MKINIASEISFQTARSGGKGGQNVNKVETMVEGRWHIASSALIADEQKFLIEKKLTNKITADGFLLVRSQTERTQLANKDAVIKKMHALIKQALIKEKSRVATRPTKASQLKRIETKKKNAFVKQNRKPVRIEKDA